MSTSIPNSALALTFTTLNTPHVIEQPVSTPIPKSCILIRVHAAALNPCDTQILNWPIMRLKSGEKGLGRDYSGVIVGVGEGCSGWSIGDEVFGLFFRAGGEGTIRQYLCVNPSQDPVAKKPSTISHEQAASIPLVALTAFTCFEWLPKGSPKGSDKPQEVVVIGASGGTGVWATQLAKKHFKCNVTAICSGRNASFVESLGADSVIDYTTVSSLGDALLSQRPEGGYDLIVDCVGGTSLFGVYHKLLHSYGSYVTIVGDKTSRLSMGGPPTYLLHPAQILRHVWGWVFGPRYGCILLNGKEDYLEKAKELVEKGEVKVEVQEVIDSGLGDGWVKGFKVLNEGRVRGKVVLKI